MRLNRQLITNILSLHQSNLDKKAINPIFSTVNIISNNGNLIIISTDGQRYLSHSIQESLENTSIFLNGTILYDIIRKSKSETFEIKETFDSYKILIDNAEFKFSKQTKEEFPEWPDNYTHKITINAKTLSLGLKTVKWAASNEESRPALNGICMHFQNKQLTLCATDCLRLAIFKIFDNFDFEGQWIVGKKSIMELIKILDDIGDNAIDLYFDKNIKLVSQTKTYEIIWKTLIINATFPNYQKLIIENQTFPASFIANAKTVLNAIDRIIVVANQHQHTIALKFLENEPSKISAENIISAGEDILPGTYNGKNMKILFDGKFLQEMLMNITGDIVFEIIDPVSPISVKNLENNGSLFIIAPIRPDL